MKRQFSQQYLSTARSSLSYTGLLCRGPEFALVFSERRRIEAWPLAAYPDPRMPTVCWGSVMPDHEEFAGRVCYQDSGKKNRRCVLSLICFLDHQRRELQAQQRDPALPEPLMSQAMDPIGTASSVELGRVSYPGGDQPVGIGENSMMALLEQQCRVLETEVRRLMTENAELRSKVCPRTCSCACLYACPSTHVHRTRRARRLRRTASGAREWRRRRGRRRRRARFSFLSSPIHRSLRLQYMHRCSRTSCASPTSNSSH